MTLIEEQWLLHRLRQGDRFAAEKLVDSFYRKVYRFLFSLCHNRDVANDLTQDTFYRFWLNRERFHSRCRVQTWLFRIAYNAYLDERKRKKPIQTENLDFFQAIEERDIDWQQLFQELTDEQRDILLLFYFQDLPVRKIADILQVPAGTVKSRLHLARARLKCVLYE